MELVRAYKLEKYMEIKINKNLFENKFKFLNYPKKYKLGADLTLDANLFYGLNNDDVKFKMIINMKEFDNFDIVVRLISWDWFEKNSDYIIRILKTNKNEKVDFQEEMKYLKCRVL